MSEPRHAWWPVARWEMSRIMRRVDFVISVLLTPALLFGVSAFMALNRNRDSDHRVVVVRASDDGEVVASGTRALPPLAGFTWVDAGAAGTDTTRLADLVRARKVAMAVVLRAGDGGDWSADLIARREMPRFSRDVRQHLQQTVRRDRALAFGLDTAQISALDDTMTVRTHSTMPAGTSRRGTFIVTLSILMLTILTVLTSISYMMVGISGEKQARVTEVVISAIPAQAWMDGKIVAFTGVGLVSGAVWAASLLLMAGPFAFQLPATLHAGNIGLTLLFALLGLYFYNAMIAALMASAQNLQSASKWQSNFVMLPLLPLMALGMLLENPDSPWMVALTLVPLFTPFLAPVRLAQGAIAPWELALALALLALACHLMRRGAGRVFRLGMLMYGKDMSLPELLRWMRVG